MATTKFIYTIEGVKVDDFMEKFLRAHPNTETEADFVTLKYTDLQWFKEFYLRIMKRDYKKGKRLLTDDNIIPKNVEGIS